MHKLFLDIGSLKIKALLFDGQNQQINKITKLINLAENISDTYSVSREKIVEFEKVLIEIKNEIGQDSIHYSTIATGTEAVRKISNLQELNQILLRQFGVKEIQIITQEMEGNLFFEVVSKNFPKLNITTIDIGGGSVQIRNGSFDGIKAKIENSVNLTTGCSTLKQYVQKQNWDENEFITNLQNYLVQQTKDIIWQSDIIVFGSNCMIEFVKTIVSNFQIQDKYKLHPIFTNLVSLNEVFTQTHKIPLPARCELWPANPGFMYDSDFVFANLITIANKINVDARIYPSNLSYIQGLIKTEL